MRNLEHPEGDQSTGLVRTGSPGTLNPDAVFDIVPEETPHLRDYWNVIRKRRWIVLSVVLIVFFAVAVGTLKQKPTYRAVVLLEINPEDPNILNFQEVFQINTRDPGRYQETQFRVLVSRTLAERVVRRLQLYRTPGFYRAKTFFGLIGRDPSPVPRPNGNDDIQAIREAYRNSIANFISRISIGPVRNSNLVEVSFDFSNPELAARIANQLSEEYIEQNLSTKWEQTAKASEWLSNQLVGLKVKLEKSEDSLQEYARKNSILFVGERQELATARLQQLQEELTRVQAERFQKESIYKLVEENQVRDLPGMLSNQLIQNLTNRIAELHEKYAEKTSIVKPDYPSVVQVKRQIDSLEATLDRQKTILVQNVVDEYQAALTREQTVKDALEGQKAAVNLIAEKSIQYNILRREVETSRQLYEGLLQRLKEAQVSAGLNASNIRIVDSAEVPESPVKPRVFFNLALGILLGAGLGVGLAFFQDYLDNTVKTPEEIEHYLKLPALGLIPRFNLNGSGNQDQKPLVGGGENRNDSLILKNGESSIAAEAYRSLRTSILLSGNPVPQVLLVTSALPKEGKTTTSINLAVTLSSLGEQKVVILDCDLRRPSVHQRLGISGVPGFVQFLTGQVNLKDVIREVQGVPNLHVIPCGPIPPNPAELLSSPATFDALQRLRAEFQYILVDSPPLLSVADSRVLATQVDGIVLVVRANATPREAVRDAKSLLVGSNVRILGVALNDLDLARNDYGYYGDYRYGFRYGYGYGYEREEKDRVEELQEKA